MKIMLRAMTLGLALFVASAVDAQNKDSAQHQPRGTASDVPNAEIGAAVQKMASAPVSDRQLRVVSINGEYNVGVGVVRRAKTAGRNPPRHAIER